MEKAAGALGYVDGGQVAPHGLIDVVEIGCDFLVCSSYKFFGPHAGILYGRLDLLNELKAYKVRPASDAPPHKFETGTQNHEGISGVLGAVEYFEWLAGQFDAANTSSGRRARLHSALAMVRSYEFDLSRALIQTIQAVKGAHIYGVTDLQRLDERVPTVSFTLDGRPPRQVAERLAQEGFYVWDGNYYALAVAERLDVEKRGGMVRVGAVHYNTLDEIARLGRALERIATG